MLVSQRCRFCARQASELSGPSIPQEGRRRISHLADLTLARWPVFRGRRYRLRRGCYAPPGGQVETG